MGIIQTIYLDNGSVIEPVRRMQVVVIQSEKDREDYSSLQRTKSPLSIVIRLKH